jgi:hypothetical protein
MLALAPGAASGFQRTVDLGSRPVEVRLQYPEAAPGATALAGEGSLGTPIPGNGQLLLRVPHVVGRGGTLGDAQLAAAYELAPARARLPKLAMEALVELPTAPGARAARPGVRASAAAWLDNRFLRSLQLASELRTVGPELAPTTRASLGASFRVLAETRGTLELVTVRPPRGSPASREALAQLSLSHALGPDASLRLGLAGQLHGDAALLRGQVGFDLRF